MEKALIKRFHELGIEELKQVTELHKLKGDFINLECTLPNSDRCYGLAADSRQMLVYEYGNGGTDAKLIVWKRISD